MQIKLEHDLCRALVEHKISHAAFKDRENHYSYVTINPLEFKDKDRDIFLKVLGSDAFMKGKGSSEYKALLRLVEAIYYVAENGHAGVKMKNLETLAQAVNDQMNDIPRRWVFLRDDEYGHMMPYFFTSAYYHKPQKQRGYYTPAYVQLKFVATKRGKHDAHTVGLYREDLAGHPTIEELFTKNGLMFATEKLIAGYEAELKNYRDWSPQCGMQFLGGGMAGESDVDEAEGSDEDHRRWGWYRRSTMKSLVVDGQPAKLVMDDAEHQGEDNNTVSYALSQDEQADAGDWADNDEWYSDDDEEETPEQRKMRRIAEQKSLDHELSDAPESEEKRVTRKLPTHPVVRLFNLSAHEYVIAHVSDLTPYPYNARMLDKLVLPQGHKALIDALTDSAITRYSDIISGKATGVIILCSGTPGTGKTLTAEVYSEVAKRPLYLVQCSQLGTDAASLETELRNVLRRATKWNAILLIDEADVYIHERGKDMKQNAVVGVFLMALEYFQGILFMTTNRATVVDDAIISRMTAHIRYTVPEGPDRNKLWHILSKQYEVEMSEEMISKAVEQFPKVSGRTIRQMLKLAKFMAEKMHGGRVTLASLREAAKYHNFSKDEEMAEEEIKDVVAHR